MTEPKFETWAIVEIMGHTTFAGFVTEQTIGGQAFVRVDVPEVEGRPAFTKLFGTGAIYCITPCGEETARAAAGAFKKQPMNMWELPRALPAGSIEAVACDDDDGSGFDDEE